jgi:hypothetical protein
MNLLIVVRRQFDLWSVPSWFGERLVQEFPQLKIAQRNRYEGAEEELRDAEIIFSTSLQPEQFTVAISGCAPAVVCATGEK